ncbi:leukotoxin LktA family filamentous adhesin [Histidinibacterium lentulum]|uniref:Leukotoxin LktA family filamentous adhesin n=1 Tax=Histidinibacterium lentulum TaxID=2480588 RepID=A0A3N2QUQ3_9RHOB|nr:leukotoxin LktA family filamentous adhesin [Histidinibacterium lentulum]ROT98944.1 leukotoxin LktA family filamentous adhesin [Histidinibacterium lentulum]
MSQTIHSQPASRKSVVWRRLASGASGLAIALSGAMPALADVRADGATATTVNALGGGDFEVTTGTIRNNTAFNTFEEFNVDAGQRIDMIQPGSTQALVNIIRQSSPSAIAGTVRALQEGVVGGNSYFVNADGFIVTGTGMIQAGRLTMSSPSPVFVDALHAEAALGAPSGIAPTSLLFAGQEPLDGGGDIVFQPGSRVEASRLDLRAGARMILDGRITVRGDDAMGTIAPAVNTSGRPAAAGVSVNAQTGVIRLFAQGEMRVGGTVRAHRGASTDPDYSGGLIEAIQDDPASRLDVAADFDVSGVGSGSAGAITLFSEGTAATVGAIIVDASATAGDGGFFSLEAAEDITQFTGTFRMDSASGAAGVVTAVGQNVTIDGSIVTRGGDLGIAAVEDLTVVTGSGISTRENGTVLGAAPTGAAGDMVLAGENVTVDGATLRADSTGADNGGVIAITARNVSTGILWNFVPEDEIATVEITDADIKGGSVVITALARAQNVLQSDDEAVEEQMIVDNLEAVDNANIIEGTLDNTTQLIEDIFERGVQTAVDLLPVQVQPLNAEATVRISGSTIVADGNWTDRNTPALTPNDDVAFAENQQFAPTGLREDTYRLIGGPDRGAKVFDVALPTAATLSSDSLVVQSHAATVFNIAPLAYGLGVAVAVTDTTSRTIIENSSLTTTAGDMHLASTAFENHTVSIAAKKVQDVAAALVVTVRNLDNQLLTLDSTIDSAGDLDAAAWTGKAHSTNTLANGGQEGLVVGVVNVSVSNSMTEAAIGGTMTAGGDADFDAETLYFNLVRSTAGTMGVGNLQKAVERQVASQRLAAYNTALAQQVGQTPKPRAEPHFGLAFAVDVQLDDDHTYATIGGQYRDLDADGALTDLGTTTVTATGTVSLDATTRFASRAGEGGGTLSRSISAAFGKISNRAAEAARRRGVDPDQLLGSFDQGLMFNASVGLMLGETRAEIGADATVTADTVEVRALTRYPNADPFGTIAAQWDNFTTDLASYQEVDPDNPVPDVTTSAPQLLALFDPLTYLTTETKAKATAQTGENSTNEEQALAFAVTVDVFNTDNVTEAVIADGATVNAISAVTVEADQESLFLHLANLPKSNVTSIKAGDFIGAAIIVSRTASRVSAVVESGATVTIADATDTNRGNLRVEANTRNIGGMLPFSGGGGRQTAINATIGARISQMETEARIGDNARITADAVDVLASDSSVNWVVGGAVSTSENVGVGASGAVNFVTRRVYAGIAPDVDADGVQLASTASAGDTVLDARTLNIAATNDTVEVTVTVAGAKVQDGNPTDDPSPPQQDQDDKIIPDWLFADDEEDALNQQNTVDTPEDPDGNQQQTGWAVAGAASVNLMLGNVTAAEIVTNGDIDLTDSLDVTATNDMVAVNLSGAVSASLAKGQDTNALAGAFSVNVDTRELRARIRDANVTVSAGSATVTATDTATVANIAVGGAGTSRGSIALAGSVAVSVLLGGTEADVDGATLTSEGLTLTATDRSTTVSVGGAVGVNMKANEGAGVGIGIGWNQIDRGATAQVRGASVITTNQFSATATSDQSIYGFGMSVGGGNTGIAGSVTVNVITSKALAGVFDTTGRVTLNATGVTITATETNTIFALSGALAGGQTTAVGAAVSVNVIVAEARTSLASADVAARSGDDLGTVRLLTDADSTITSIAVAGGVSLNGTAAGAGISTNVITATAEVDATDAVITYAEAFDADAQANRTIASLAGAVAVASGNAGGAGATLNLILGNTTKVILQGATVSTRTGALTADAISTDTIRSLAAAISASGGSAISGGIAVNIITGMVGVDADLSTLTSGAGLTLNSTSNATIQSLSGGAAIGTGGNAVGAAVSANFINQDVTISAFSADLTATDEELRVATTSNATIDALAVGLSGGSANAVSGSVAVGDIGNNARVNLDGATVDAGTGGIVLTATKTDRISILSGAAAFSGSNAVGGAITVALIHGAATADLVTDGDVTGSSVLLTASNSSTIDAIAVAGSGSGNVAVSGSVVYTQIGRPSPSGPSIAPLPGPSSEDPITEAQSTIEDARDEAVETIADTVIAEFGSRDPAVSRPVLTLDTDDITRARLELLGGVRTIPALTVSATETSTIRSLAGGGAGGGVGGFGAGFSINLLFGKTEAQLAVAYGSAVEAASINVAASQIGTVETAGVAAGIGGSAGGAGSIALTILDRGVDAGIVSRGSQRTRDDRDDTRITTAGDAVSVTATQTGSLKALAGAVAISGGGSGGGAIVVNVLSDDAEAKVEDVSLDLRAVSSTALSGAGAATVAATQSINQEALSAAAGGGATGAFAGSFAVNVADGEVLATVRRAEILAGSIGVSAVSTNTLMANAGAVAADGGASVGLSVSSNTTAQTVRTSIASGTLLSDRNIVLSSRSTTGLAGNAVAGAFSGGVAVTGSGVGNVARNTVETLITAQGSAEESVVVARGSVAASANATNNVSLLGGANEKPEDDASEPGLNLQLSGGGVAGIGASASVNLIENTIEVRVDDASIVTGLGYETVDAGRLGRVSGVALDAYGTTGMTMVSANGAAGGIAAVTALFSFNIIDDTARIVIGSGTRPTGGAINAVLSASADPANPDIGNIVGISTASASQRAVLDARVFNDIENYSVVLAVGGTAGVGVAAGTTLVSSTAEIDVNVGSVQARGNVDIAAEVDSTLDNYVIGAGGGFVGVAGSAGVNIIRSEALITLTMGEVRSIGGDVSLGTLVDTETNSFVGSFAGGLVAAGGAVQVNLLDSTSRIRIRRAEIGPPPAGGDDRDSFVEAGRDVTISAETRMTGGGQAVSGSGGGAAVALSANVTLAEATTEVLIGDGQKVLADRDIDIGAEEALTLNSLAGAVAVGAGAGVGASLDYVRVSGTTRVMIGENGTLRAGRDLDLTAESVRRVDSLVAVGTASILASVSAAIGVVEMGGAADDPDGETATLRGDVDSELKSDQSTSGGLESGEDESNTPEAIVSYAGGDATRTRITTERSAIDVLSGPGEDVVRVEIGAGTNVEASGDILIDGTARTRLVQRGGGVAGGFVGVVSGTTVANVQTGAVVDIRANTDIEAGGDLSVRARTGGALDTVGNEQTAIEMDTLTVGGGAVAAGVGVSVAKLRSRADVLIGSNARLAVDSAADALTISAERSERVRTEVDNLVLSGIAGIGAVVVNTRNEGQARILRQGGGVDPTLRGGDITLSVRDRTSVTGTGWSAAGGLFGSGNGVDVRAINSGRAEMNLIGLNVQGRTFTLTNVASGRASATAFGASVAAGLAVGGSYAEGRTTTTVNTALFGTIETDSDIAITTRFDDSLGTSAFANAESSSGALIGGNGAEARALLDYSVTSTIGGLLRADQAVTVLTEADGASARAVATGRVFGAVAIGATIAEAGQTGARTGVVTADFEFINIFADQVDLGIGNGPDVRADAIAGSGGLISGSGAENTVRTGTVSALSLGTTSAALISTDLLTLSAVHDAVAGGLVDTTSASAIGVSGARSRSDHFSDMDLTIGGGATLLSRVFKIDVSNEVRRPEIAENEGFNVESGSGGIVDVAAMESTVDVTATTDLTIVSGASLTQLGLREELLGFEMGVATNMALTDRMKLDSGGAIAVPVGNSFVRVNTNTANVTIGDVDIFATGILTIYAGSNSDLYSEVDTKTYGLAGAGVANTEATFNAVNEITVGSGAEIESLNDIIIQAGHVSGATQSVTVTAESRVFNKTAIPIPTDPAADATANTSSLVNIDAGARVIAVRHVSLFADDGGRNIRGYGRGKDLYREALAEIGSAISNAFGGDDVSLDIESGTSTDNSTDVVTVDGYVRAGSRNKQVLILDENNQLDNPSLGVFRRQSFTNEDAEGIEFELRLNQSVVQDITDRIAELEALIGNLDLSNNDPVAKAAWEAELIQLTERLPDVDPFRDEIHLGPIVAQEGNIYLRGDSVIGASTGTLEAPGDSLVLIQTYSDATIVTDSITIPDNEGGRIFFNDNIVSTPAQVAALSRSLTGPFDFEMISREDAGQDEAQEPLIQVEALGTLGSIPSGSVVVDGPLTNFRGTVRLQSRDEDIDVRADIDALTVDATAGRDFLQGFTLGFTEVDGSPDAIYASRFRANQDARRALIFNGINQEFRLSTGNFTLAPREGRIRAGRNVYISADKLNINGLIQAGTGQFDVELDAGLGAFVDGLASSRNRILLHDPLETDSDRIVKNPDIRSDVPVYYNTETGRIEIDPMIVQGGRVILTGNILSTGAGVIQSLDGFGVVNVTNNSGRAIQLNRVDLGPLGEAGNGVEGLIRITDTSRTITRDGQSVSLTTEYRRIGNEVRVFDNQTVNVEFLDYGDIQVRVETPSNLIRTVNGRTESFQPTLNRDYVTITAENVSRTTDFLRKDLVIIGISGTTEERGTPQAIRSTPIARTDLGQGPYLADSLGGGDYAYAFSGVAVTGPTNGPQENFRKTHDSVEWWKFGSGWRHFEWSVTRTATHLYTHRLKADYPVDIVFGGSDVGSFTVNSNASVFFGDNVTNFVGDSTITATSGDIMTTGKSVVLQTAELELNAPNGRIGSLFGSFRIDQTEGATLTARAATSIDIREMNGNMLIDEISTSQRSFDPNRRVVGGVTLRAEGSIAQSTLTGANGILASTLDITSDTGGIGQASVTGPSILNVGLDGTLTARALGQIDIRDNIGDLGVNTVASALGGVTLRVPNGALLDRNDVETRDIRTESELTELYVQDLALNGSGLSARQQTQIDALKAERERLYDSYWRDREAAGGGPLAFTLDPAIQQSLLDPDDDPSTNDGWTQAQLDAYIAEREALYALWNADASRDPAYVYTPTTEETAQILQGSEWTAEELTRSIRAGLIRGTADTISRVEDPNVVAAGDIRLIVSTEVGELTTPYVIPVSQVGLTAEDLRVLNSAERTDVIRLPDGSYEIQQSEDFDFAFTSFDGEGRSTGRLFVTADNEDIFLGGESAASVAEVRGTREVQLKIDGAMTDARTGATAIRGQLLVLESGNTAAIGEPTNPLTVEILTGGSLVARGGTGVYIDAPLGDMPIGEVFSNGPAVVTSAGAITDVVGSGVPRLQAGDITMRGTSVGTETTPFIVNLTDVINGRIDLETTVGDIFFTAASGMPLERARIAGGGRITATGAASFTGTDTIVFGTGGTLTLILPEGVDTTTSSGTDIEGGALVVESGGSFGTEVKPIQTALVSLDYTGQGTDPTPLVLRERDDLRVESVLQPLGTSLTDILALGAISVGIIDSQALVRLDGAAITDGRIIASELRMRATGDIGALARIDITTGRLFTQTTDGDAFLLIRDRATDIEEITIGGTGVLSLTSSDAPATLLAGPGISTQGGTLDASFTSLLSNADILSNGGALTLGVLGNLTQSAFSDILSGGGALSVTTGGDHVVGEDAVIGSAGGALGVTTTGDLTQEARSQILGGAGPVTIVTGGNHLLKMEAGVSGRSVSLDTTLDLTQETDADIASTGGPLLVITGGDLTQGPLADLLSGGGSLTTDTTGTHILGAGGRIASSGGPILMTTAGDLLQRADGDILAGTGPIAIVTTGLHDMGDGAEILSEGGDVSVDTGGDITRGSEADIASGGGDLTITAGANHLIGENSDTTSEGGALTLLTTLDLTQGAFADILSGGGALSVTTGGNHVVGEDAVIGSAGGALGVTTTGSLTQEARSQILGGAGPVTIVTGGSHLLKMEAGVSGLSVSLDTTLDLTQETDADIESTGGPLLVVTGGNLTQGPLADLLSGGGSLTTETTGTHILGAGGRIASSGGPILMTTAGDLLQREDGDILGGAGSITIITTDLHDMGDGAEILSEGGEVIVEAGGDITRGSEADIASGGGDLTITAGANHLIRENSDTTSGGGTLTLLTTLDLTQGVFADILSGGGLLSVTTGGNHVVGEDAVIGSAGGVLLVETAADLTQDARSQILGGSGPVSIFTGGDHLLRTEADVSGRSVSVDTAGNLTQQTDADIASTGGPLLVITGGNLTQGPLADLLSGGGSLTTDTAGTHILGAGGRIASSGGPILMTTAGDLLQRADGDILAGTGPIAIVTDGLHSMANGAEIISEGGEVGIVVGTDLVRGRDANIFSGGGDLGIIAGGDHLIGPESDTGSSGGEIVIATAGELSQGAFSDIRSGGGDITLATGGDHTQGASALIRSGGGDIAILTDGTHRQRSGATIASDGGSIEMLVNGALRQAAGSSITGGTGTVAINVGGGLTLARIATLNATRSALELVVGGRVDLAANQPGNRLIANAPGSLAVLRFGSLRPQGPDGLRTSIARLDAVVGSGPMHIQEADGIRLENLRTTDGQIDVFARGEVRVDRLVSQTGEPITVSALGDLTSNGAILAGGDVRLFAFDGAIRGSAGQRFRSNTQPGTTVYLYARNDIDYLETQGSLRAGFAISETGSLRLGAESGGLDLGVLGAGGELRLTATGSLSINTIGNAVVDLAPEVELALVRPEYYGRREAASPLVAILTASGPGSAIDVNMISVRDRLVLQADRVTADVSDRTPEDGLVMTIRGGSEEYAVTDVDVFDAGVPLFLADPFAPVTPRLDPTAQSDGALTLIASRIASGEVTFQGQRLSVEQDSRIGGDVWFRQRSFDVLATIDYRDLDTTADAQVFDPFNQTLELVLENEIDLTASDTLVLNRRLGGTGVNGGQGFNFEVGVETDIQASEYARGEGEGGTAYFIVPGNPEEVITVRLPLILSSL